MNEDLPLGQKRLGEALCDDVARGKRCPHHEELAAEYYEIVVKALADERELKAMEALDRLVKAPVSKILMGAKL